MAMDFEQILKDEKGFPDNLEVTVGDHKVPLGAMRDLSKKQQQILVEQLNTVQQERERVAARNREAQEMTEKAASIYQNLQQQLDASKEEQARAAAKTQTGGYDPEQLYQTDLYYAPMRKRNMATEESLKKIIEDVNLLKNTMGAMGRTYVEDRLANEYESTAEARKRSKALADYDFPKLRKYAEENKIQDHLGFASIKEAVNRLTDGERKQEEAETAYQRGLREGEIRARMGVQPRPASASAAMPGGQQPKDLDEALSPESISQDQELMQMLSDLQHQGADLIGGR